jgi:hypothetical protein
MVKLPSPLGFFFLMPCVPSLPLNNLFIHESKSNVDKRSLRDKNNKHASRDLPGTRAGSEMVWRIREHRFIVM